MSKLILQGPDLNDTAASAIAHRLGGTSIARRYSHLIVSPHTVTHTELRQLREDAAFDINLLADDFDPQAIRLLITDMDSTFINIECIDEIADFANLKPQVAKITESAMRGEINFETSLTQRVGLLKGLSTNALQQVYDDRLRLNPGGDALLTALRNRGIKIALVSGGFTFFTDRLKKRYALDYTRANELEIINDQLTGKVAGQIVGAEGKADFLRQLCSEMGIGRHQVIAVGDGANDLKMMAEAGLSIAYHAKPAVQAEADIALNHCGLEGIIALLE